ncbi:MAG: HupE/UreJ family protein [Pedosphaera sp.]|nr:HupE/UreJ family protein [Pedosphaera sp.]
MSVRICVYLLLIMMSASARSHQQSDTYLTLKVEEHQITGSWEIAVRDIDRAVGLDTDGDGAVTVKELREAQESVARYLLSRLEVKLNGTPVKLSSKDHLIDNRLDGAHLILRLESDATPTPRFLVIDYKLFFDLDPNHRGLLRLEYAGETEAAVFDAETTSRTFELGAENRWAEVSAFVHEGVWHIWKGYDHILFLLALLLPSVLERREGRWKAAPRFQLAFTNVFKIVTAFTIAHSITLGLATYELVRLPSRLTESVIAASVALAALHNFRPILHGKGWMAAFGFGLVHGFGFANVLTELGLQSGNLLLTLLSFNGGVELGQLAIVAVFLPVAFALRGTWIYREGVLRIGSAAIIAAATVWLVERVFDLKLW